MKNIVLALALLALVSGMAVYGDNGVQGNQLVKATSTEPQEIGDAISILTNEAAVPSCQSDIGKSTAPGCCSSIDQPRAPSCCGDR